MDSDPYLDLARQDVADSLTRLTVQTDAFAATQDAAGPYSAAYVDLVSLLGDTQIWKLEQKLRTISDFRSRPWRAAIKEARGVLRAEQKRTATWKDSLILSAQGTPHSNLDNAIRALCLAPEWKDVLAWDLFGLRVHARQKTPWGFTGQWGNIEDIRVTEWLQAQGLTRLQKSTAIDAVETAAALRSFHPVREYLDGLKWDGDSRLDTMLTDYFGVVSSTYVAAVSRRWPISAVSRIFKPGCQADYALILEGAQGLRKSTGLRILGSPWFTDQITDIGSKDASMDLQGKWIVEIPEMMHVRGAANNERAKGFLSRRVDHFRPPYARRSQDFPRQNVFAGGTNIKEWGTDDSGLRRYWMVECGQVREDLLARDRDQLWAEAVVLYRDGVKTYFETSELEDAARAEQADRLEVNAWDERIQRWVENSYLSSTDAEPFWISMDQVLTECLQIPIREHPKAYRTIGSILRVHGMERYKAREGKVVVWRYRFADR